MSPARKPWEYEEIQIEKGAGRDFEGDLWLYAGEDVQIGVVTQEAPGGADAWARMFQASSKMVRTLQNELRRDRRPQNGLEELHTKACWEAIYAYLPSEGCARADCKEIRSILISIGALP